MTSEEKLAKIMAMRAIRKILSQYIGTVDYHGMITMFENEGGEELSTGELQAFHRMKQILRRTDDSKLEGDMKELDTFKEILTAQFDGILRELRMSIAG